MGDGGFQWGYFDGEMGSSGMYIWNFETRPPKVRKLLDWGEEGTGFCSERDGQNFPFEKCTWIFFLREVGVLIIPDQKRLREDERLGKLHAGT